MTKEVQGSGSAGKIYGSRSSRMESVEDCLGLMDHLSRCESSRCSVPSCSRLKAAIKHAKDCKRKGQCALCKQVIRICVLHAKNCLVTNCKVHFCGMIRLRLSVRQEALKNQGNKLRKDQKRQMVNMVTTVGHQPEPHKPVDEEVGFRYDMVPLQRSFSLFNVKPANTAGRSMDMQRSTSYNDQQSVPEIIGSGLIQAIGTPNGTMSSSKNLATTYEKMDIANY